MSRPRISSPSGRSVPEWIGASPDAAVPDGVQLRIFRRQKGLCAILAVSLKGRKKQLDHKIPLSVGGQHRETNLQWILSDIHTIKSAHETKERAKADRVAKKYAGISRPKATIAQRPKEEKTPSGKLPVPERRNLYERI
jgi:5-methylcytosine-specific restriction enzyme A